MLILSNIIYLTDFSCKAGENDIGGAIDLLSSTDINHLEINVYENEGGRVDYLKELENEVCKAITVGKSINFKFHVSSASCGAVFYVFCHQKSKKHPNQISIEHSAGLNDGFELLFHQTRFNVKGIDVTNFDIDGLKYDSEIGVLSIFESDKYHSVIEQLKTECSKLSGSIDEFLNNNDNNLFSSRFDYALSNLDYFPKKSVSYYRNRYDAKDDVVLVLK